MLTIICCTIITVSTIDTNTGSLFQPFPALKNDNLLRAARGEPVDRIPVWVMRQAGRYLPEFQEVRAKHDFFEVCRTPELACEVTMQPLRRFDLDASIIFSDILVIPQAYGMEVIMEPGRGPVFPQPLLDPTDMEKLNITGAVSRLQYVGDAITMMRHLLDGKVPLIGFTGAPWTLMGYMIEGGGSKTMSKAKAWLTNYPEDSKKLLTTLTGTIVEYLEMQVKSGAQMLQVFESSAEHLSKEEFLNNSLPYLKSIRDKLNEKLKSQNIEPVPMVVFAKGGMSSLEELSKTGYEVIGIDYSIDPTEARQRVGPNVTVQGNLDPQDMYKPPEELKKLVEEMVKKFGRNRYIANLGHGITPQTPIESMSILVETVHSSL